MYSSIIIGSDAFQVDDLVDLLTDANDTILERINMNLGKEKQFNHKPIFEFSSFEE